MTHKVQIGDAVRDATADEAAHIEQIRIDADAQTQAVANAAVAAASGRAKLAALGLTEAEIAALVG